MSPLSQYKAKAERLGAFLDSQGLKLAHSNLLHAIAAIEGHKNWQTLKAAVEPVRPPVPTDDAADEAALDVISSQPSPDPQTLTRIDDFLFLSKVRRGPAWVELEDNSKAPLPQKGVSLVFEDCRDQFALWDWSNPDQNRSISDLMAEYAVYRGYDRNSGPYLSKALENAITLVTQRDDFDPLHLLQNLGNPQRPKAGTRDGLTKEVNPRLQLAWSELTQDWGIVVHGFDLLFEQFRSNATIPPVDAAAFWSEGRSVATVCDRRSGVLALTFEFAWGGHLSSKRNSSKNQKAATALIGGGVSTRIRPKHCFTSSWQPKLLSIARQLNYQYVEIAS